MKKLLLLMLVVISITSCDQKKEFRIVNTTTSDTIRIESSKKNVLILTKLQGDRINELRPKLRDVAYYFIINKDKQSRSHYEFKCGKFKFWKCNGIHNFNLTGPKNIELTNVEKTYFYNMYQEYKKNPTMPPLEIKRLYEWEDDIEIIYQ